jgi:hypothetical protein
MWMVYRYSKVQVVSSGLSWVECRNHSSVTPCYGEHKPKSLDFLRDIVNEDALLKLSGLSFKGHNL